MLCASCWEACLGCTLEEGVRSVDTWMLCKPFQNSVERSELVSEGFFLTPDSNMVQYKEWHASLRTCCQSHIQKTTSL